MTPISFRDIEQLSAYLDDGLSSTERARLESRLKAEPQLASALQALGQARAALRRLPQRRVPRNFTLTPKMARVKPPLPRSYPVFRFASAFAAILFFFTAALNLIAPRVTMIAAAPAAYGVGGGYGGGGGGGGGADPTMEQSLISTEAAQKTAPLAPPAEGTATPAGTPAPELSAAPTATPEILAATALTPEATPSEVARAIGGGADTSMENQPAPSSTPVIPGAWQLGFIIVAVISGAIAYFTRWRADKQFDQTKRK